jgi:hypothetical protein
VRPVDEQVAASIRSPSVHRACRAASSTGQAPQQRTAGEVRPPKGLMSGWRRWLGPRPPTQAPLKNCSVKDLDILVDAALSGRRPQHRELAAVRRLGPAQQNKAWMPTKPSTCTCQRLGGSGKGCRRSCLPHVSGRRYARTRKLSLVITDAVEVLIEGHQDARRT